MVKTLDKTLINKNNPLNYISDTLTEYSTPQKSRQQINKDYYEKNKEERQKHRREKYQQQKLQTQEQTSKYYGTQAIKVLMSFKEYTELNQQKHKLWLDFNWTLKDCQESIKEGFADIVAIMKLEQVAGKLIRDYWATSKQETKKSKSWNSLTDQQQQKLIRYWGYEKARIENGYLEEGERLEKQSQEYLKTIKLAKFHEERGKNKCECYQCQEKKEIQVGIKEKLKKVMTDYDRQNKVTKKEQCPECGRWVKELDEENDICKKCLANYEN